MKYNNMTFGRMEAIINKLGGEEGIQKFLVGETLIKTKEEIDPFISVFNSISVIQKHFEGKFRKAGIDLELVTVCNNKDLPSFQGSAITDSSGSSLDIEFKNKQGHFLIIHLFNRKAFCCRIDTYEISNTYPMEKLDDPKFLEALKVFFNKKDYGGNDGVRKAAFSFMQKIR